MPAAAATVCAAPVARPKPVSLPLPPLLHWLNLSAQIPAAFSLFDRCCCCCCCLLAACSYLSHNLQNMPNRTPSCPPCPCLCPYPCRVSCFPNKCKKLSQVPQVESPSSPQREKEAPYKGSCRMARESFLFEICKTSCSQVEVYLSSSSSSPTSSDAFALLFLRTFSWFFFLWGVSAAQIIICSVKLSMPVCMQYKPDFMTPIKTRESPELGKYEE